MNPKRAQFVMVLTAALLAVPACGRLIPNTAPPPGYTPYYPTPAPQPRPPAPGPSAYVAPGSGVIDQRIDSGTLGRVQRATRTLAQCEAELASARVTFSPTPDRVNSATCGLTAAGVLGPDMGTVARMAPGDVTMTCALAAAVSVWRRQSVEPAARELLGSDVVQIDHMGVYACRAVNNGRPNIRPSAHSRAAALDFSGVRLRDGRRITVAGDWNDGGPEAAFLRRIRDDACKIFGTTLSPDYNAQHHDHLHLEAESGRLCR
ncbi:extensin family protein [Brevundimonas sp. NIBR11]|uniref:extensin family protein n=1 Tax=Brevundimonas sp. NIBR11 TaxID=3015999 RepID=UPI0022EFF4CE|nr:extensin family protein [Brevundimonas sp. NIBR11]